MAGACLPDPLLVSLLSYAPALVLHRCSLFPTLQAVCCDAGLPGPRADDQAQVRRCPILVFIIPFACCCSSCLLLGCNSDTALPPRQYNQPRYGVDENGWPGIFEQLRIKQGQKVTITTDTSLDCTNEVLPITYPKFPAMCEVRLNSEAVLQATPVGM